MGKLTMLLYMGHILLCIPTRNIFKVYIQLQGCVHNITLIIRQVHTNNIILTVHTPLLYTYIWSLIVCMINM